MWNRGKREDEPAPPRPVSTPPSSADLAREGIPLSTFPTQKRDDFSTRGGAVIGKSLSIKGTLTGREDVLIDGRVDGDVELLENRVTVGAGGHVQGGVRGKEVVIYGTVNGNLEASEKIEIRRDAKVVGDLRACRIVIEDEAYFKGNVDTIKTEPPKPVAAAAPPAPAARQQQAVASASSADAAEAQASLLPGEAKR